MKIRELISKLEKYPSLADVVVTVRCEEGGERSIWSISDTDDGWLPSGVISITGDEFIGG